MADQNEVREEDVLMMDFMEDLLDGVPVRMQNRNVGGPLRGLRELIRRARRNPDDIVSIPIVGDDNTGPRRHIEEGIRSVIATDPHLKYRTQSLQQTCLLQLASIIYNVKANDQPRALMSLSVTTDVRRLIERTVHQMELWGRELLLDLAKLSDEADYQPTVEHHIAKLYVPYLHWNSIGSVDYRETARFILKNKKLRNETETLFLIAANNCLEDHLVAQWGFDFRFERRLMEGRAGGTDVEYARTVRLVHDNRMATIRRRGTKHNPVVMYWMEWMPLKIRSLRQDANDPPIDQICQGPSVESAVQFCLSKRRNESFEYFWPILVGQLKLKAEVQEFDTGSDTEEYSVDQERRAYDHLFHTAIEQRNVQAAYFIWSKVPAKFHSSMLSAATCCSSYGSYYAFECAIVSNYVDLVRYLWQKTTSAQHHEMLLAEHCNAFRMAVANGSLEIVRMMWQETTRNEQFLILFENSAAAFRSATAGGYLEIVSLLWLAASGAVRIQILEMYENEAMGKAIAKGHTEVVQFIWDDLSSTEKFHLLGISSANLSSFLTSAASCGRNCLQMIQIVIGFTQDKEMMKRALNYDQRRALKAILQHTTITGKSKNDFPWLSEIVADEETSKCVSYAYVTEPMDYSFSDEVDDHVSWMGVSQPP